MEPSLYTIPVQEIFAPEEGCPFCRLHDMLEERCIDYILGAAMMEPAIRQETNRLGFCGEHLAQMQQKQSKLPLALMLQSHLEALQKSLFSGSFLQQPEKKAQKAAKAGSTCYVCNKIEDAFDKLLDNTVVLYGRDPEFRKLFARQEALCLPHYLRFMEKVAAHKKQETGDAAKAAELLCKKTLDNLCADVTHFTKMFDYRNKGGDWKNSRDAIERTAWFLTGEKQK